jgi:protein SCO1/2
MGTGQKLVTTLLWGLAVLGMLAMVGTGLWAKKAQHARDGAAAHALLASATARDESGALPVLYPAPQFSLTDQTGTTITHESLRGNVWVAMVFFTECPGICPGMVGQLMTLQETLKDPRVKLVPFSIDPEHDTPQVLKQYADRIKADPDRWHLLTGTKDEMFAAAEGLKLAAEPAKGSNPIVHSGKLLLIDAAGDVRGVYDHKEDEQMAQLAKDAAQLVNQSNAGSSPSPREGRGQG